MDNWNIMVRMANQAHFHPLWDTGTDESTARMHMAWRLNDRYWSVHEYQLVTDYSSHYINVEYTDPIEGTYIDQKLVVDGWKAAS